MTFLKNGTQNVSSLLFSTLPLDILSFAGQSLLHSQMHSRLLIFVISLSPSKEFTDS
jgi:hypothetical protein